MNTNSNFPNRRKAANKDIEHLSYRPPLELSGELVNTIREGETKLQYPFVVADVGAAQALDPRWEKFGGFCTQIGFEPDRIECERLQAMYQGEGPGKTIKLFEPTALWHSHETRVLNITRDPDATSFYEPNASFFERLPDPTLQQVVARVPVSAIPLDAYELPFEGTIDAIKLDVQAAELDVMKGAIKHMNNGVLAVIGELLFTPHYIEQPWFGDFDSFMRAHGYQVFDIDLRRWRRRKLPSQFDNIRVGGISYGDTLYLKDPLAFNQSHDNPKTNGHRFCIPGQEREKLIKLAALAEFFAVPDYGLEVLEFGCKEGFFDKVEFEKLAAKLLGNQIIRHHDRGVLPR